MKVSLLVSLLSLTGLFTFTQAHPPAFWFCLDSDYNDGRFCDCNCGDTDPDCDDDENRVIDCDITEICVFGRCQLDIPATWTDCPISSYASNDGCDCECGAFDPDCIDSTASVVGCDNGICDSEGKCHEPLSSGQIIVIAIGSVSGTLFGAMCVGYIVAGIMQRRKLQFMQSRDGNVQSSRRESLEEGPHSEEDLTPTATVLAAHELGSIDNIPQAAIDSPFGDLGRRNINQDSPYDNN